MPDDEDGVLSPLDLQATAGTQPTITVLATNTTGNAATLFGWIDYNRDGVFDNASERTSLAVPAGTSAGRFTLTFPTIPAGTFGPTYARFRLSTDAAAANSTGPASDGEVEDYPFSIVLPSDRTADSSKTIRIASDTSGGPTLSDYNFFGSAIASIGDLDRDGVADLAVGAPGDNSGGNVQGAVYVLFMNADGSVKSSTKIAHETNGGPALSDFSYFGTAVTALGDLNADGVIDLAVGAVQDDTGGFYSGAVYVLFMNTDGTVKNFTKIAHETNGGPTLDEYGYFGGAVSSLGDLNHDGVIDLAVGASHDDTDGLFRGAVYVLFMNADGTVKSSTKIAQETNGGPALQDYDYFGTALASLGDLNHDGVTDLAVGALGSDNQDRDAVYVLLLNTDGTVNSFSNVASNPAVGLNLKNLAHFRASLAAPGDLDADGIDDLIVGGDHFYSSATSGGEVHLILLNADGTAKGSTTIGNGIGGGPYAGRYDLFGSSVAAVGDLNGDGLPEIVVGAPYSDTSGFGRGAAYVLFLTPDQSGPTVAFTRQSPTAERTNADSVTFRATFSEDAFQVDAADFAVVGSTALIQNFSAVRPNVYEITVSGGDLAGLNGVVGLALAAGQNIVDRFGHGLTLLEPTYNETFTIDNQAPALLSFRRQIPQGGSTSADGLQFRVEFDEDVVAVEAADFAVTGTTATITAVNSIGSRIYDLTIQGGNLVNLTATVGINLSASQNIADLVGHALPAGEPAIDEVYVLGSSTTDFGDAPDSTAGTGRGNYATRLADNGPRHSIVAGLRLGAAIDAEPDVLPDATAAEDDRFVGPGRDDEDGILFPGDLQGTIGGQPTVTLLATNATGNVATLYGWIDYNRDGAIDNASERTSIAVPAGTTDGRFTLTFPTIPAGQFGATYARFRLSTDAAAANSTGPAADGEVEDYAFNIMQPIEGVANFSNSKYIGNNTNGGPVLFGNEFFGVSVTVLGDVDGDGVIDLAVGAPYDESNGEKLDQGAVYVLFMNADGTAKSSTKIASGVGGGPMLASNDNFGSSVASLGDMDGNGVPDLAAGAINDNANDPFCCHGTVYVYVLYLNADGTAKNFSKISVTGGIPASYASHSFGNSIASLGDLDGDGVTDLAVGAENISTDSQGEPKYTHGAVHVLRLNADGTVKSSTMISDNIGGGPELAEDDHFGRMLSALGDVDGDGIVDLAVGGNDPREIDGVIHSRGAVYVMFLNADGTARSFTKIANHTNGGPDLPENSFFGSSLTAIGDINADGVTDLAVFSYSYVTYDDRGLWLLHLNPDGTAKQPTATNISNATSIASLGDLSGKGNPTLAIGSDGSIQIVPFYATPSRFAPPQTIEVPEGMNEVATVSVDLPPGTTPVFTLTAEGDFRRFYLDPSSGQLYLYGEFGPPDFETPLDADGDNVYDIRVLIDDQQGTVTSQVIHVRVTDVVTPTEVYISVPENTFEVTRVIVDSPPGTYPTFALAEEGDYSYFSLDPFGGYLYLYGAFGPPDFEDPLDADGDNVYDIRVLIDDQQGNVISQMIHVTVTDMAPELRFGELFLEGGTGQDGFFVTMEDENTVRVMQWLGGGNAAVHRFPVSEMYRIVVTGGDSSDFVYVARNVPVGTTIEGGGGFDFLRGGGGSNLIVGGPSSDLILGGDGRDVLIGGAGFDLVFGGDGDDVLVGGEVFNSLDDLQYLQYLWNTDEDFDTRSANVRSIANLAGPDFDLLFSGGGQNLTLTPPLLGSGAADDKPSALAAGGSLSASQQNPRLSPAAHLLTTLHPLIATNPFNPNDINGDGWVTPQDALASINDLNLHGVRPLFVFDGAPGQPGVCDLSAPLSAAELGAACNVRGRDNFFLDASLDDVLSALDTLQVINALNAAAEQAHAASGEGEAVVADESGQSELRKIAAKRPELTAFGPADETVPSVRGIHNVFRAAIAEANSRDRILASSPFSSESDDGWDGDLLDLLARDQAGPR